jgi:transcriptional regulator with XRE-family HTH domain
LRKLAKSKGLSLRDLSNEASVSAQAISKYVRDLDVPSSGVLIRLAKALKVRAEYLMRPVNITLSQPCYRRKASLNQKNYRQSRPRYRIGWNVI